MACDGGAAGNVDDRAPELGAALDIALALSPTNGGQTVAQRELVASLEAALDARRQRILVSESSVNWVKWAGVILLAALTLAIAFVHCDNRLTAAITLGMFASAVAVSLVMIAAQDRPFAGQLAVGPIHWSRSSPNAPVSRCARPRPTVAVLIHTCATARSSKYRT